MDVDQRAAMRVMVDDMYTTEVIEPVVCPMTLFSTVLVCYVPRAARQGWGQVHGAALGLGG